MLGEPSGDCRVARLEESVVALHRLRAGEAVTVDGEHGPGATHPAVWRESSASDHTGRRRCHLATVRAMECTPEALGDGRMGHQAGQVRVRRCMGLALASARLVLVVASACSSNRAPPATLGSSRSTAATGPVVVTEPAVPPATKDCGTTNALAGWPTTMVTPPNGYACILDALVTGTPAQMSVISAGSRDSGRQTQDGYDIPTRRIVTWLVLGKKEVQVTTDLTEDDGTSTTRTCTGLAVAGSGALPQGIDCS